MTTVYFARHGETEWNLQHRFQGNKDSKLTEKGITDAELLSQRMEEIEIDYIVASPLARTVSTAEIIRGDKNIEIIKDPGLMEINFGEFEGLVYDEIKEKWPDKLKLMEEDPFSNSYPDGDSLTSFYSRVEAAFKNLIGSYRGKKILVVAHGGTIKCIESFIRNAGIKKDWVFNVVSNCSLSCIQIDDKNNITELFFNDTSHLKRESAFDLS